MASIAAAARAEALPCNNRTFNCLTGEGRARTSAPFARCPAQGHRCGGVAQLVRVSACHAEGRGFEPRRSRH